MTDLLFEIGTEEIPARFMPKALADLVGDSLSRECVIPSAFAIRAWLGLKCVPFGTLNTSYPRPRKKRTTQVWNALSLCRTPILLL